MNRNREQLAERLSTVQSKTTAKPEEDCCSCNCLSWCWSSSPVPSKNYNLLPQPGSRELGNSLKPQTLNTDLPAVLKEVEGEFRKGLQDELKLPKNIVEILMEEITNALCHINDSRKIKVKDESADVIMKSATNILDWKTKFANLFEEDDARQVASNVLKPENLEAWMGDYRNNMDRFYSALNKA